MNKLLLLIIVILMGFIAIQGMQLNNCRKKADRFDTCAEVQKLKKEAENATDDDLTRSLSGN